MMIHNEEHQNLRRALELLPAEVREAVILRYYSEPQDTRMHVMGKTEGTIKSRLSRRYCAHEILLTEETFEERR